MKGVLLAAVVALVITLLGTPLAIRFLRDRGYGQLIRDDGPTSHHTKRGTPTMGGAVFIVATVVGYLAAHIVSNGGPTASGLLVLYLMVGLGAVGLIDDLIKILKQRSLGLRSGAKLAGQAAISLSFGVLAIQFENHAGLSPASTHLSFIRDTTLALGPVLFVIWAYIMIAGASNGVNLTDGLDGLATGAAVMVLASYVVISFWQFGNSCMLNPDQLSCYTSRDPLDIALVASAAMGACFGFLWWNASPARIFMGDTGSLALGGLLAGLAIVSRTEMLLLVLGGLFVVEAMSVIIQVGVFKATKRRIFNMAPIHHHFELAGWAENTVIVRFWIIAGLAVAFGLGAFYAEFLSHGPLG